MCDFAENRLHNPAFIDQRSLANERIEKWPNVSPEYNQAPFAKLYSRIKVFGFPNEVGARTQISTRLNHELWNAIATGHQDDDVVLSGINFGFSLQYMGGPLNEIDIDTRASGDRYRGHIQDYLTEIGLGAIAGPYDSAPFYPWVRTSPIMTRPKADSHKRRIIIDLSYPPTNNVNQAVIKNNYYGRFLGHSLPRIDDVIEYAEKQGFNIAMATIDIKRAYRNFLGCPLDYPLNTIRFQNKYFVD